MTFKTAMLLSAAVLMLPVTQANAGDRYSTPPPMTLSPDLSSPWLLQLQNAPRQRAQRTERTVRKKRVMRTTTRTQRAQRPVARQATGIFAGLNSTRARTVQPVKRQAYSRLATPQANNARATAYIQKQASQRPLDPRFLPQMVQYETSQKPGTIIIDTHQKFLYLVMGNGKARRYGVGVGKAGFEWSGTERITRKAEWPSWRPPAEMIARERKKGRELPAFMEGGPANPMGARALYLGSTLYRIHGTNQPWTIGQAVSSGCIRMRNEDVMDLYERAQKGAKVIVT
jgi:lipoprotein-anchoring transpeptidase ErfK/SrfK